MLTSQLACRSHLQTRDETDRGRNLVCGETLVTDTQDLALTVQGRLAFQDDIGHDQRTGDRASPRPDDRHSHGRVAVDDGLNFVGVDLQPTDIGDSAPSTKEERPSTTPPPNAASVHKL